jgi:hypothetical protein
MKTTQISKGLLYASQYLQQSLDTEARRNYFTSYITLEHKTVPSSKGGKISGDH